MSTRRDFLFHCSSLLAAATLAPWRAMATASGFQMKDIPLHELSFATLAKQVNSAFRVAVGPGRTAELELVEASRAQPTVWAGGPRSPRATDYESFSLLFAGSRQELLSQQIFKFEHDEIGRFELFIVPVVSRDASRHYYEAVFNRPVAA